MRNLAKTRIEENKQQLEEAQKNISDFESGYQTTFEAFKVNFLTDCDNLDDGLIDKWRDFIQVKVSCMHDRFLEKLKSVLCKRHF